MQITSKRTSSNDWKLKSADCKQISHRKPLISSTSGAQAHHIGISLQYVPQCGSLLGGRGGCYLFDIESSQVSCEVKALTRSASHARRLYDQSTMAQGKKRSRADTEARKADMPTPQGLALSNPSFAFESRPNTSDPGHSNLPSASRTSRRQSAIAKSALAKTAQYHDASEEQLETPRPKRVKKVTFAEDTKDPVPHDHAPAPIYSPASTSSTDANMTEVRARAARHKGQMNFEAERMCTQPARFKKEKAPLLHFH